MDQLRVHNWDKWQTYRRDRGQPPWIKVHREVSRHFDWLCLSDAQRGQLLAIWILAADRDGMVPADPKILQRVCGMSSEPDVNMMIDKGFLDVAPRRRQHDATATPQRRHGDAPDQIRSEEITREDQIRVEDSPAPLLDAGPAVPEEPAVIGIVLNDGSYHGVTQSDFMRLQELYPAVDTMAELRKIAGWNEAHPKKRKTKRGIRAHIASWFATQQDRGGGGRGGEKRSSSPAEEREQRSIAALKMSLEGE